MSVVCNVITFESFDVGSLFSHIRYISRIKFVYENHRVKVKIKVSGANRYSRNVEL